MKELKKATMLKVLAFPASAIVAMALGASPVFADETEPTDDVLVQPSAESDPVESSQPVVEEPVLETAEDPAAEPTGVIRSGDKDTFAKDMPFGTITIQTEDMKTTSSNFSWESDNPDIKYDKNAEGYVKNYIVWAPNGMGVSDVTLDKEDAHVDGSVTLKWAGIATLQDGSKGDVVMTISNLYFDVPRVAVRNDQDKVIGYEDTQASGPIGFFSYTGYLGPAFARQSDIGLEGDDHVVAMTCDIKVQVLKNGSVVDGDVLFSTFDLDVTDHHYGGKYNEGFEIVDGAISPAYIPETNHNLITGEGTETSANGVKFEATKADTNTYDSGFVVMADNNTGIRLHWQGKGQRMGTRLFTGNISHNIQSS
ncbi:MAG: hypothetical protein J6D18_04870, partial [Erysipelotrichaceae bacterium]|nr:hypothetical protein [Erysipelotrichaceae bacterium]